MDFNQFDSRSGSETARPLHLRSPGTGELLYDDEKPCLVYVMGIEGETGQKAILKSQRERLDDKTKDGEPVSVQVLHDRLAREIAPLITGFENVNRGDKPAKAPDDVEWFLSLQSMNGSRNQRSFAEQVRLFAGDRSNYLGKPSAS